MAWGLVVGFGALSGEVEAEGYDLVDPARIAIATDARFVDPRWRETLLAQLASRPIFRADDVEARVELERVVSQLSFVSKVEPVQLLWPDGAALRLRFERPVACLRRNGVFYTVSDRGAVLPGGWSAPPELDGLPLPVLGTLGRDEVESPPGAVLGREGLWHGLAVVLSMERHLSRDTRAALGVVTIDGDGGAVGLVDHPGAKLYLEGRRVVYFGRTPDVDAPGELPEAAKWRHVEDALQLAERGDLDWLAVDVRWDQFAAAPRVAEELPTRTPWISAERRARTRDGASNNASAAQRDPRPGSPSNPSSAWSVQRIR